MRSSFLPWLCLALFLSAMAGPAFGLPPFKKPFLAKYVDPLDNEDFKKTVRKANCNVCHVKGEKKDVHNEYGLKLADFIEGNSKERMDAAKEIGDAEAKAEKEKLVAELNEAFVKVEEMENAAGMKFGDILRQGELPVPVPTKDAS